MPSHTLRTTLLRDDGVSPKFVTGLPSSHMRTVDARTVSNPAHCTVTIGAVPERAIPLQAKRELSAEEQAAKMAAIQADNDALVRARDGGLLIKKQQKIPIEELTLEQVQNELAARGINPTTVEGGEEGLRATLKSTRFQAAIVINGLGLISALVGITYLRILIDNVLYPGN